MTKASTAYGAWIRTGMDMWMLGAEAGTVMAFTKYLATFPALRVACSQDGLI